MTRRIRFGAVALLPFLVAGAASAAPGQRATGPGRALSVDCTRYWRAPGNTLLEGLVHVDFAALGGTSTPAQVDFAVLDDAARTLHSESWDVALPPIAASGVRGEVSTPFTVALAPGKYVVSVRLSHGVAVDSVSVPVEAFATAPALSDLVATPAIRVAQDSEALAGSEMRRGRYVVERVPRVALYAANPGLAYYIELYPGAEAQPDQVSFDVRSSDGARTLFHTGQAVQVAGAGSPLVGRLNLAGLPTGDYRLVVGVKRADALQERSAGFTMLPLDAVEPRIASAPPPRPAGDATATQVEARARYFSPDVLPDSVLKGLVEALVLAPPGPPPPKVLRTITGQPLRDMVAQYFARLDPTPGTGRNQLYEEYADRLKNVNRLYSEPQTHRPGVHTDRGRIYMKYGAPDEKTEMELENRHNLELWKYSRQRGLRFVFLDETGFGHLNLIMSTDPNEPSAPDWQERIGDDTAVRQIMQ